jgi:hypothetical protein
MFINKTNNHKFHGKFILYNIVFEYMLYLPAISTNDVNNYATHSDEIISYFGNRFINGERCLNIDTNYVKKWITSTDAYLKIFREDRPNDIASCTLQIHNPCMLNATERDYQVYIYDLCRINASGIKKKYRSPVYALFYFIENLAYQNLGKKQIYLMVDTTNEISKNKLIEIYTKYGFQDATATCITIEHRFVMTKHIKKSVIFNSSLSLIYLLK